MSYTAHNVLSAWGQELYLILIVFSVVLLILVELIAVTHFKIEFDLAIRKCKENICFKSHFLVFHKNFRDR